MSEKPTKTNARKHGPTTETKAKYGAAERLYAATTLSCRAICALCGVSLGGFTSYLHHHRRDLLLARYGIDAGNIYIHPDYDDGISLYEGEAYYAEVKYEFEINAENGNIISWEAESIYD